MIARLEQVFINFKKNVKRLKYINEITYLLCLFCGIFEKPYANRETTTISRSKIHNFKTLFLIFPN